ncbi:MAG: ATP-dependent DNA helicase RecG [Patescibacteria group bacterium]
MTITPTTPLSDLPRIGKVLTKRLHKLGLARVLDLLFYFPFRYEDFSTITPIARIQPKTETTVCGTIDLIANKRAFRRRMYITECLITDETGSAKAVWFNQPFITKLLRQGDLVYLSGKVEHTKYGLQFSNPSYEKVKKEQTHTARIIPIYSLTENLTEKQIRYLIRLVLPLAQSVPEWLPDTVLRQYRLMRLSTALHEVHFPTDKAQLGMARRRLKFDELLLIQLKTQLVRHELSAERAPKIHFNEGLTRQFVSSLPFTLTPSQKKAAWEILQSLGDASPMNRLLEGDVGAGKTVVAALIALNVATNGYQTALMAPTEILALQHFKTLHKIFKQSKVQTALITSSAKQYGARKTTQQKLLKHIEKGSAQVVIGTHALIQERVRFNKLGLAIIDEQHRFGVDQRKTLKNKTDGYSPHLLSMTATPIPRSLALTLYGDLDISAITELPRGRKKVLTKIVPPEKRQSAYGFIRREIESGRQAFVICPLIEESDKLGVRAATAEYNMLSEEIFPDLSVGLVHGKLSSADKKAAIDAFEQNKASILVATAVVEVGVDIPNASVMVIEGAERFGLAQLHQFRGRVGRAEHQSYCLVFTESNSDKTLERLNALITAKDGFELAEKDLEFRGPGEIYGLKQSGFPELKIAKLTDRELIRQTREAAESLLTGNKGLSGYPLVQKRLKHFSASVHLE